MKRCVNAGGFLRNAGQGGHLDESGALFLHLGCFSGRREGLHPKHLAIFGTGLACDFLGTQEMNMVAMIYGKASEWHNVTGIASLAGMGFHFLLVLTASLLHRAEAVNVLFHRVSLTICSCWLLAFASGAVSGMMRMKG